MRSISLAVLASSALTFVSGAAVNSTSTQPCGENGGTYCETEGFVCKPVNEFGDADMKCMQDNSHYLFKRQTGTNVLGVTGAGVVERLPIQRLQADTDAFNIFLYGLASMQAVAETNSLSYYQLAGIHGRPFIPWQEPLDANMNQGTGYCTHSSALFPTWHRPYLALIEQRLYFHCIDVAGRFAAGPTRDRYLNAARRVRLPYWDWSAADLRSAIPTFVMTARIQMTVANAQGAPVVVTVANPLYQYTFTNQTLKNRYFAGIFQSMAATRRHPPPNGVGSQNQLADRNMRNTYNARRQNTFNLFSIPTFNAFSNTAYREGNSPITWLSVESIHNEIHVNVGGNQGHMSLVDYSSFDPIFWLHHVNIDRLVSMYQAIYPARLLRPQQASTTFARRVRAGDVDDLNTPLRPFRNAQGQWFTSQQLSSAASIWALNYAYPEVPVRFRGANPNDLSTFTTGRVNALYSPSSAGARLVKRDGNAKERREWICHIVFDPAEVPGTGSSPECLVFLGQPSSNAAQRKSESNLVGSASSLGKQSVMGAEQPHMKITACVPLSDSLEEAGVDVNDVKEVVKYLKENLKWTIQRGNDKIVLTQVPSLLVGVSSAKVSYPGNNQLPVWGEFETFYEATQNKKSGMTVAEKDIVKSIDVTDVLDTASSFVNNTSSSSSSSRSSSTNSTEPAVPETGRVGSSLVANAPPLATEVVDTVSSAGVGASTPPRRADSIFHLPTHYNNYGQGKSSDYDETKVDTDCPTKS